MSIFKEAASLLLQTSSEIKFLGIDKEHCLTFCKEQAESALLEKFSDKVQYIHPELRREIVNAATNM